MKQTVFFLLFFASSFLLGQVEGGPVIKGQLVDAQTKVEIRFAKIYNRTTEKGTITDDKGYFQIGVLSDTDEVIIRYIGYQSQNLLYQLKSEKSIFYLNQKIQLIDEVLITPKDLPYLYQLIHACKKKASNVISNGKAVYELKSYLDEEQIELVEGYYNFQAKGYDLDKYQLKTARLGVQMKNEKMFVSLESSRAIATQKLLYENDFFPHSPFEYSVKKMMKYYSLQLRNKFLNDEKDSVFIIDYTPRNQSAYFFEGTMWLNKTNLEILKVETNCKSCKRHPFVPIFSTDTISNIDLYVTRTFEKVNGKMVFNHVDFKYDIKYKSRVEKAGLTNYDIKTQAVLFGYKFGEAFDLPLFEFEDENIGDYRKVNAIPYNDFFWKYNDEDKLADRKNRNELFMSDSRTIESRTLFAPNTYFKKGLLEHPYKKWSTKRFIFRQEPKESGSTSKTPRLSVTSGVGYAGPLYNLKIRVFADINTYGDSTNLITATVFDPYESFSRLPQDARTHCFINMYFDLYEIARLQFLEEFKEKSIKTEGFRAFYITFFDKIELEAKEFLRDVERGQNKEKMMDWNSYILQNLGIDNMDLFKPFETRED